MSRFVIAQIIGILGIICYICSYQIKSNKALYVVQLCGSLMFCIQFFLLGAITGCYSLIILMARNALLSVLVSIKRYGWKSLGEKDSEFTR